MKIFLDDTRDTPEGYVRCYWPDEVIELLKTQSVSLVSLDHDLGDDERGTGYDVVIWIEEQVYNHQFTPPTLVVHSANISAVPKMKAGIKLIEFVHGRRRNAVTTAEKEIKTLLTNAIVKWHRGDFEKHLHRYHRKGILTSRFIDTKSNECICKIKTATAELTMAMVRKSQFNKKHQSLIVLTVDWLTTTNNESTSFVFSMPIYCSLARYRRWLKLTLKDIYQEHDII